MFAADKRCRCSTLSAYLHLARQRDPGRSLATATRHGRDTTLIHKVIGSRGTETSARGEIVAGILAGSPGTVLPPTLHRRGKAEDCVTC